MHRKRFMPGILHTAQRQICASYVIQKLLFLIHADILRYAVYHSQWVYFGQNYNENGIFEIVNPLLLKYKITAFANAVVSADEKLELSTFASIYSDTYYNYNSLEKSVFKATTHNNIVSGGRVIILGFL